MDGYAEHDFLLGCLAAAPEPARLLRSAPQSGEEWNALIERANRHGVTPLLYSRLKGLGEVVEVPPEVRRSLKRIYLATANRNAQIYHQLSRILGGLREAGERVIVLKGAHLAELVYGNVAVRAMSDVDLLVASEDFQRAGDFLRGLGLASSESDDHHAAFHDHGSGLRLELHWEVTSRSFPVGVDLVRVWARALPARVAGVEVEVLSPEDLLLHLCFHAAYHHQMEGGLRALCDIAAVIRHHKDSLDWDDVCSAAGKGGLGRCVHLMLSLAEECLAVAIPERVFVRLGARNRDSRGYLAARDRLLEGKSDVDAVTASVNVARLSQGGSIRDRAGILARCLVPSRDVLARMYSVPPDSWRVALCYPRRFRDVFSRHGKTAWHLVCRDQDTLARITNEHALRTWLEGRPSRTP